MSTFTAFWLSVAWSISEAWPRSCTTDAVDWAMLLISLLRTGACDNNPARM
jgi:hypothetical protein